MRAINAIRELNDERDEPIRVIALYTETERHALFVRQADERYCLGPATDGEAGRARTSTTSGSSARSSRREADAAWVGWGFVAEHPAFAELCERLGIVFVGPTPDVMRALGDKIEAKKLAEQAGVPVAPWSGGAGRERRGRRCASRRGARLPADDQGRRGRRRARHAPRRRSPTRSRTRSSARSAEAAQAFGDKRVLMERLVGDARHVEVQLIADGQGGVWALGVRDCSYQRRHQKVVEESASPALNPQQERELARRRRAARPPRRLPRRRHRRVPLRAVDGRSSRSWRSTRASRSSTPSRRWSPAPTSSRSSSTSPRAAGWRATRRRRAATRSRCA